MDQFRTLLWLRLRLALGFYRKRLTAVLGLVFTVPALLAMALAMYFAGLVTLWGLPPLLARQLLSGALTALYVSWLLFPLVGVSLNQGFDPGKLLQYPVSPRRIFAASIVGALLEPYTLACIVALAAIPVGLATGPVTAVLLCLLVAVFVFHTLSFSQAALTLLWGLLKSRRVQDFWKVVAAVSGMAFWAGYHFLTRRFGPDTVGTVVSAEPARFTRFLPSGWTADAALALSSGDTTGFLTRFAALVAVCVVTVAAAGSIIQRMYTGELEVAALAPADRPRRRAQPGRRNLGSVFNALPPGAAAMARKEWTSYIRDPVVKIELLRGLFTALVMPFFLFLSGGDQNLGALAKQTGAPVMIGYVSILAFVGSMSTSMNLLAREREGITLLATLPTPRLHYLLGKNAAAFTLLLPVLLAASVAGAALAKRWDLMLPAFIAGAATMLVMTAAANLASVYYPTPLPKKGQNPFTSSRGGGCLGAILGMLAIPVVLLIAAPIPAAVLVPAISGHQVWLFLTVPLSLIYGLVVYAVVTLWSAKAMLRREPEILASLLRLPA